MTAIPTLRKGGGHTSCNAIVHAAFARQCARVTNRCTVYTSPRRMTCTSEIDVCVWMPQGVAQSRLRMLQHCEDLAVVNDGVDA